MKKLLNCVAVLLVFMFLSLPVPIFAQEEGDVVTMEETVVTASRLEESLKYSPDSVTIVTGEEIQKKGKKTVIDVLRDVPGVFVKQNGSPGGSSSIYTRGTNNAHTLIMIDGVRVGDPMATDGKMSIADLSTDNIERIEIVRGAQSVLYGSDAIGGVINIITKKGEGKPKFYLSSEGGSFETFRERAGVSGSNDKVNYAASVSRLDVKRVSRADEDLGNIERDYYNDTNISARVDGRISETVGVGFSVRHSESAMDYDDSGTDADKVQDTDITSISTNFNQDIFDWWQHIIKFGITETKREYTKNNGVFDGTYNGTIKLASWQHNFFIGEIDTITAGFDYQEENGDSQSPWGNITNKSVNTKSFFVQNKLTPFKALSFTLGARHDDHQTFGGEDTYKGALAYLYEKTGTKVRGSYGTGFRAPSLYQLYSSYGDPNLKPEESKGYDAGIDQELFDKKVLLSATYFHTKIDDLIDYNSSTSKYYNVGKVKTEGWETGFSVKPVTWLSFNAHYTYTEAKNEDETDANNGKYLRYRTQHTGGASLNIKPLEKLNVNLNAQYVGKRYREKDNSESMPAYTLYNLVASYDVMEWLKIFGRVENLTDKKYQSIYKYGEPGIGFYGGVKVTF
ncbi:MAG: TonB-dependent receptor [Desulfobacterales bacterium]|uniref:TonB-dependent receptor n=1 Tax=Candidatus Desulfaltia bathyphila TaxID=2841697 RepID=A0A8J6T8D0_9BACT|nr:TonB-dependent receptor [Candidatus Desulfaltia bathyphila]MBL7195266.1 TonB-dependent receptor [Desulfobacterales bacterium]MBL7207297.1 TonB-dependent receptor [Desulfobacterales bacterium]